MQNEAFTGSTQQISSRSSWETDGEGSKFAAEAAKVYNQVLARQHANNSRSRSLARSPCVTLSGDDSLPDLGDVSLLAC